MFGTRIESDRYEHGTAEQSDRSARTRAAAPFVPALLDYVQSPVSGMRVFVDHYHHCVSDLDFLVGRRVSLVGW